MQLHHAPVTRFTLVGSPLGPVCLTAEEDGLSGVYLASQRHAPSPDWKEDGATLAEAARQLGQYFAGARRAFDLPLASAPGTDLQRDVWRALTSIPYGETVSYGEVAASVGRPSAVRAIGAAIGKNPWSIVVPCHRVVGGDGKLTGYAGGLARKRWLLEHEGLQVRGGRDRDDPKARLAAQPRA